MPQIWTVTVSAPPAPANEVEALRAELAQTRIKLAAAEDALRQWQLIHDESNANWRATYVRDTAILKAALMDVHEALLIDRESPENRPLAGMVRQ